MLFIPVGKIFTYYIKISDFFKIKLARTHIIYQVYAEQYLAFTKSLALLRKRLSRLRLNFDKIKCFVKWKICPLLAFMHRFLSLV